MTLTTLRRRAGVAGATAALAAVALTLPAHAVPVEDSVYAGKTVMSTGHLDLLYVDVVDGQTTLLAHTDAHGDLAPEDLVLHAKPSVASRTVSATVATLPGMKAQGETYYLLPQTSQLNQLFVGFGYSSALPSGTQVTHEITDVDGPGELVAWQNTEDGPSVFFGSHEDAPAAFTSQASHEHINWGLTELGEYRITVTSSVTVPGGTAETLAPGTYTIFVGEELPAAEDPGTDPGDPGSGPGDPVEGPVLSITGLGHHYHAGGIATLTAVQEPDTGERHYHWFTRAPGSSEWTVVPGAESGTYSFVVRTADHGLQVKVVLYGDDHGVLAESEPVTIAVDDHGNDPVNGPTITATLPATEGALTVSVAPENREVDLGELSLTPAADRYTAEGDLKAITVTDTRAGDAGWVASGRVRAFTTIDGARLTGAHLGWQPTVLQAAGGQSVVPGPEVVGTLSGGPGLGAWRVLGQAPEGASRGTAQLGAHLLLEAPTTLEPGTYTGMLILTVI